MRVQQGETRRMASEMCGHLDLAPGLLPTRILWNKGQAGKLGNSQLGPKWDMGHAEGRREVGEGAGFGG